MNECTRETATRPQSRRASRHIGAVFLPPPRIFFRAGAPPAHGRRVWRGAKHAATAATT